MNDDAAKLEDAAIWEPDGHLSELALSVLVDAELTLLPPEAPTHAESCELCAARLGQMARVSLEIDATLAARVSSASAAVHAAREWPWLPLCCALALSVLGRLPALNKTSLPGFGRHLKEAMQLAVRVIEHVVSTGGAGLLWLCALTLLAASSGITHLAHRRLAGRPVQSA